MGDGILPVIFIETTNMLGELRDSLLNNSERKAFCINENYFSYQDLYKKVGQIASAIIAFKHDHPVNIGVVTVNRIETYASMLACWFTGNAYVPLNPNLPLDRNKFILDQANVCIILAPDSNAADELKGISNLPIILTAELVDGNTELKTSIEENSLMYILFTSGSTGTPKGVPINYRNLAVFTDSFFDLGIEVSREDRFLQMFDLTFDVSVASFLIPLLKGACVFTVPSEGIKYMNVYKLLKDKEISVAFMVPSIINYLRPYYKQITLPLLKYCILTAEASLGSNVEQWFNCIPNGIIINLYGPTEATIWCTGYHFDIKTQKCYNGMLAIGKPFKHVKAYILDEQGNELGAGEKGELCIASEQLTTGYLNDQERTTKAFRLWGNIRLYKTGDLCYTDETGDIYYCGRMDHQVKIQGFRIELNEIEAVTKGVTSVNNVAVVYRNKLGVDQICLFLEKYPGEIGHVKKQLEEKLPYYMVPSQIRNIEVLPHNSSSKIDRVALSRNAGEEER